MASLPLFKIGVILFKEMAKPIAAQIKTYAVEHGEFKRVTMTLGRGWEGFSQRVEIMFRGHKLKELKAITDAHALTVGADVVSQSFLISVAVLLVLFEFYRGNAAKVVETAAKAEEKRKRQEAKEARFKAMEATLQSAHARITELEARVEAAQASWVTRVTAGLIPGSHASSHAADTHSTASAAATAVAPIVVTAPAAPSRHLVKKVKARSEEEDHAAAAVEAASEQPPSPQSSAVSASTTQGSRSSWWSFGATAPPVPPAAAEPPRLQ